MRIKVTRGSNPSSLFDYLFDPGKQRQEARESLAETEAVDDLLICRSVPGRTAAEFARNFKQISKLNLRVRKTVAHYSISLPTADNEKVGPVEMHRISRALLEELGHGRSPYFGVAHHDTAHRHWHLAASTVSYDGSWVDDSFERNRIRKVEKTLETAFGLEQTQLRPVTGTKNLSTGEYRLKRRTKKPLPKEKLWAAIDECVPKTNSLERFVLELRVRHPEVSVQLKEKDGKHVGISFAIEGIAFAGRSLGRAYSLHGLNLYHGIRQRSPTPLVYKVLSLSQEECSDLYLALEQNSKRNQTDHINLREELEKPSQSQIEA